MKDGKRQHVQKGLILRDLSKMYEKIKMQYPDIIIEFSKFAQVRPPRCVLAGASGTFLFAYITRT